MIRIYLLPYIFLEIVLVVLYILEFGFLSFFIEIFLSAIIGVILLFNYGFSNLFNNINYFNIRDIFGSLSLAIGGFALIIPGMLSDIFGLVVILIALGLKLYSKFGGTKYSDQTYQSKYDDEIIDVEIIEERDYEYKNRK
ncbi:FxsA family protein [Campylobacter lanienae]|uniref:FxsA family protein n=1 Tax=Campylobacter lanienae TaxID=75658 RepID=UPI000BB4242C|nr:FxsA family protein [Campylobacter lanienae]